MLVPTSQTLSLGSSGEPDHRKALDGLRGIAAALVVFGHASLLAYEDIPVGERYSTALRIAAHSSHPSVILFFVLSGFVLYLSFAARPNIPYGQFIVRRIARIYPAVLAVFAVTVVFYVFVRPIAQPGLGEWSNSMLTLPIDAMMVIRNALLLGVRGSDVALDSVTWSLALEMRFSLIFPILAALCRNSRPALIGLSLAAYVVGYVLLFQLGLKKPYFVGESALGTIAITLFYFPGFGLGIVAADYFIKRGRRITTLPFAATLLTVALLVVAKAIHDDLGWAIAFTALILASCQPGVIARFAQTSIAQRLGRISYSLYLVHVPILIMSIHLFRDFVPEAALLITMPLLSVLVADQIYRFVELPGIALGKRLVRNWHGPLAARAR